MPRMQAIRPVTIGGPVGHFWEQTVLAHAARSGVLVSLGNSGPLLHPRQLVVIHDAAVFRTPENYGRLYRVVHRTLMRLLSRGAHLATVSRFSQEELAEILGLSPDAIAIIPDGVALVDDRARRSSTPSRIVLNGSKYLLCVGSLAPNKNLIRAIEAFRAIRRAGEKLVIVGGMAVNVFKHDLPVVVDEHIILAGRVSDEELQALYQHAEALIFPSIYEGFGLPPLEAMAHGCLVLASNIKPVREACAEAALYFDPYDTAQMASTFRKALSGPLDRARLIENGKRRVSLYTWTASAEALRQTVYEIVEQ